MSMDAHTVVVSVPKPDVVVMCYPDGPYDGASAHAKAFIGALESDLGDGTLRVTVCGFVEDLSRAVFWKDRL